MRITPICLLVALLSAPAWAATYTWQDVAGDYNGNFSDPNHWSPAGPPPQGNDAVFNSAQATPYTVTLTEDAILGSGVNNSEAGSFNVQTDKLILDVSTFVVNLHEANGAVHTTAHDGLNVGLAGQAAELTITSSALSNKGSMGRLNTFDAYNIFIGSGAGASGTVEVTNGATLKAQAPTTHFIGQSGGTGILDVNGGQVALHNNVTIGSQTGSSGSLIIRNGGSYTQSGSFLILGDGAAASASVLVDGANGGATLTYTAASNRSIFFGNLNNGSTQIDFEVINGGTVTATSAGFEVGGNGRTIDVRVAGDGSLIRGVHFNVGGRATEVRAGSHTVTVEDDGILSVGTLLRVWEASGAGTAATVVLDDGFIEIDGNATPGSSGIELRGILRGNGTIRRTASSTAAAYDVNQASMGQIRPGDVTVTADTGTLNISDANLNAAGELHFDIAALSDYDQIVMTGLGGSADITGQVLLNFLDGYTPLAGHSFGLLSAETISFTGTSNLNELSFDPNLIATLSVLTDVEGSTDVLTLSFAFIPEPTSFSLLVISSALLAVRRRRAAR